MPTRLSDKQQRFVDVYDGNATAAARLAGYTGTDASIAVTASRLLKLPKVAEAIRSRQKEEISPLVATRQERQAFWTGLMKDSEKPDFVRLKASELLGRSEADFTDKLAGADGKALTVSVVINRGGKK